MHKVTAVQYRVCVCVCVCVHIYTEIHGVGARVCNAHKCMRMCWCARERRHSATYMPVVCPIWNMVRPYRVSAFAICTVRHTANAYNVFRVSVCAQCAYVSSTISCVHCSCKDLCVCVCLCVSVQVCVCVRAQGATLQRVCVIVARPPQGIDA